MKKRMTVLLCIVGLLVGLIGCAGMNRQYQNDVVTNSITGAAIGGATGAIGGLIFGGGDNIWKGALGGATIGAYGGALGTEPRQRRSERQVIIVQPITKAAVAYPNNQQRQPPPGQWVTVPGRWVKGKWVPAHDVWVPINP